ncbi:MAG: sugar phosphate isomerase/epimerase [Desulfurococcales archaeon]|nr:sugar phosphate isomerase/epimerase [Desulfurococcales archaeon]
MKPRLKGLSAVHAVAPPGLTTPDIMVAAPIEKVAGTLSKLGYSGIEPNIADPSRFDASSYKRVAGRAGLEVAAVSTGLSTAVLGVNLSHHDDSVRARSVEAFKRYVEIAAQMDSTTVVVGLARGSCSGDCRAEASRLRGSLEEISDTAKAHGIVLALEPINRYETRLVNTVEEAKRVIRGLASTGLLVDTFHSLLEEPSPYRALVDAGNLLAHVHVADSNRRAPGLGIIDWTRIMESLQEAGYRGFVSVEARVMPNYEEHLKKAADTLLGLFAG